MNDPQHIIETFRQILGELLRVTFCYIGITILLLAILTIYKKHQRELLWGAGIVILLIVFALVVFGVLDIYNLRDCLIVTLGAIIPGVYAYYAEKTHKKLLSKMPHLSDNILQPNIPKDITEETNLISVNIPTETVAEDITIDESETSEDEQEVFTLPVNLATPLARTVFGKCISEGLITVKEGHYQWNGQSKALLAYMCGKIYCEDYTVFQKTDRKNYWKQGTPAFPDTALNSLFHENALAQSRKSRNNSTSPEGFRRIDSFF